MAARSAPTTRTSKVLHLMLGTGAIQAGAIIVFITFARQLGPAEFGAWRQLFVVHQVAQALIFSAVPMSLLRFSGHADPKDVGAIIRQHLWLTLGMGFLVVAILFFSAEQIATLWGNERLAPLLRIFAPQTGAVMIVALVAPTLVAVSRTTLSSLFSFLTAAMTTFPLLIAASYGADLRKLVIVSMLASVAAAGMAFALIIHITRPREVSGAMKPPVSDLIAFLWPLLLASGVGVVGLRMDHIIVSNRLGPEVYAAYAIGAFEIPVFGLLQSSVTAVLLPQFSALVKRQDWGSIATLWKVALFRSAVVIFPLAAMLIVLAEDFITLMFGKEYIGAATIFRIYLLLSPLRIMTFGLVLRAGGETRPDFFGAIGYLIGVSILAIAGVEIAGARGAMLAVALSTFMLALYLMRSTQKFTGGAIRLRDMYPPSLLFIFISVFIAYQLFFSMLEQLAVESLMLRCGVGAFLVVASNITGLFWCKRKLPDTVISV